MQRFFRLCIEIEEMVAEIYRDLAASSQAEDGLKSLWLEMATQEEDHARQIRLAARLPEKTIRAPRIDQQRVEQLHAKAKALLGELKKRTLRQETALRLSLRLEQEFAVVHVHCAVEFADASMQALFQRLAADDERHAGALAAYCQKLGISLEDGEKKT